MTGSCDSAVVVARIEDVASFTVVKPDELPVVLAVAVIRIR